MTDGNAARIERVEGEVMPVNSYLVAGESGLVVVDGQLTVSDARKVRAAAEGHGLPIAGMVLTHGHPDHYAGAATLLDGLDVPIVATAAVDAVIRRDDALKETIVGPMMGAEWPSTRRFPDRVVESGSTVEMGGVTFGVVDLGPGESDADSLWTIGDRIVFAGDLVYDAMDAYLADGRYAEWLAVLDRLEGELAPEAVLFPGHGRPRGRDALEAQRRYVRAFVDAVGGALDLAPEDRRARVVAALAGLVRDERLRFLVELSIEPVAGLLRDRATGPQRGRAAAPAATGVAEETSAEETSAEETSA